AGVRGSNARPAWPSTWRARMRVSETPGSAPALAVAVRVAGGMAGLECVFLRSEKQCSDAAANDCPKRHRRGGSILDVQFSEDALDVLLRSACGHLEDDANLQVRLALRQPEADLGLPGRQLRRGWGWDRAGLQRFVTLKCDCIRERLPQVRGQDLESQEVLVLERRTFTAVRKHRDASRVEDNG